MVNHVRVYAPEQGVVGVMNYDIRVQLVHLFEPRPHGPAASVEMGWWAIVVHERPRAGE